MHAQVLAEHDALIFDIRNDRRLADEQTSQEPAKFRDHRYLQLKKCRGDQLTCCAKWWIAVHAIGYTAFPDLTTLAARPFVGVGRLLVLNHAEPFAFEAALKAMTPRASAHSTFSK